MKEWYGAFPDCGPLRKTQKEPAKCVYRVGSTLLPVVNWRLSQLSTFDLYPGGEGHGVQGQICDILRPQLAMNRFLPLWPHRFPHFENIHLGEGGGGGGSDIRSMSSIWPICKCWCPPLSFTPCGWNSWQIGRQFLSVVGNSKVCGKWYGLACDKYTVYNRIFINIILSMLCRWLQLCSTCQREEV